MGIGTFKNRPALIQGTGLFAWIALAEADSVGMNAESKVYSKS